MRVHARSWGAVVGAGPTLAHWWFFMTLVVVFGHVAFLAWKHNLRNSLIWLVKLVTDPFTDIAAYYGSPYRIVANPQGQKRELA
jgi:glutamate-1-semialdehyde 2,1-aminomutase